MLAAEVLRYGGPTASVGVDLIDVSSGSVTPVDPGSGPEGFVMPAFLADGRLLVALIALVADPNGLTDQPIQIQPKGVIELAW